VLSCGRKALRCVRNCALPHGTPLRPQLRLRPPFLLAAMRCALRPLRVGAWATSAHIPLDCGAAAAAGRTAALHRAEAGLRRCGALWRCGRCGDCGPRIAELGAVSYRVWLAALRPLRVARSWAQCCIALRKARPAALRPLRRCGSINFTNKCPGGAGSPCLVRRRLCRHCPGWVPASSDSDFVQLVLSFHARQQKNDVDSILYHLVPS
jgi:hypothetical protein